MAYLFNGSEATKSMKQDILALCGESFGRDRRMTGQLLKYIRLMNKREYKLDAYSLMRDIIFWDDNDDVKLRWGNTIARQTANDNDKETEV